MNFWPLQPITTIYSSSIQFIPTYPLWYPQPTLMNCFPAQTCQKSQKTAQTESLKLQNPNKQQLSIHILQKKINVRKNKKSKLQDKTYSARNQNSQRNQQSNTLKYLIKYIQGYSQNDSRIIKILDKFNIKEYYPCQFFKTLQNRLQHHKNYLKLQFIKSLCNDQDQNFSIVFRVLLKIFFRSQKSIYLVFFKKLKKKAKLNTMLFCRSLGKKILNYIKV